MSNDEIRAAFVKWFDKYIESGQIYVGESGEYDLCSDCYDRFDSQDLEDKIEELMQ